MNNQYRYFGQTLTLGMAQELIQELFAGHDSSKTGHHEICG